MPSEAGPSTVWLTEIDCDIDAFRAEVEREVDPAAYPHARLVDGNVLIYDAGEIAESRQDCRALQAEWVRAFDEGPGVVVLRGAFPDAAVVDRASAEFEAIIAEERATGPAKGDHFAKPGANDRVWNALEKLAVRAPEVFADYYANPLLAMVSEAWLGPGYQVTSQINVVNPGGEAQAPHRDYHLGFTTNEQAAEFPAHVHRLSPALTLQGAVAHGEMPLESGPTTYLPFSQRYVAGYLAWRRPDFRAYFEERSVQLAMRSGDAVFFNPAVFHAAGANRTPGTSRMANLLQVSSALGRAMESVDRARMVRALYPELLARKRQGAEGRWLRNVVAAAAAGYPFPTNLDRDPPMGGLAPASQAAVVHRALAEEWEPTVLAETLSGAAWRRASH